MTSQTHSGQVTDYVGKGSLGLHNVYLVMRSVYREAYQLYEEEELEEESLLVH